MRHTYTVISPIHRGRRYYGIGAAIDLDEAEARRLSGFIDVESKREAAVQAVSQDGALQEENEALKSELTKARTGFEAALAAKDKTIASRDKAIAGLKKELVKLKEKPAEAPKAK